jgi:hypothetical protein
VSWACTRFLTSSLYAVLVELLVWISFPWLHFGVPEAGGSSSVLWSGSGNYSAIILQLPVNPWAAQARETDGSQTPVWIFERLHEPSNLRCKQTPNKTCQDHRRCWKRCLLLNTYLWHPRKMFIFVDFDFFNRENFKLETYNPGFSFQPSENFWGRLFRTNDYLIMRQLNPINIHLSYLLLLFNVKFNTVVPSMSRSADW